ncbi:hypothetical protein [Terasakiella pusilla]|uniref:hypothetical protein n=2 Tax=Terasakiella pusilla TaxID=64973 RepID=UPI003AA97E54
MIIAPKRRTIQPYTPPQDGDSAMPFQLLLPWLVMLPMIYGSTLVGLPLFLAILLAAIGLSAMHICDMTCPKKEAKKSAS